MEVKRNEATRNRPEGDRVIDGAFVISDISAYEEQLHDEKAWDKNDRNAITVFKSENLTMVLSILKDGAELGHNSIDGFVTVQVLKGKIEVTTKEGTNELKEHHIITFHPNIEHNIVALKHTHILITNYSRAKDGAK